MAASRIKICIYNIPSCIALSSNERGVVSVLEDAIILCGNCSPPTVRLAKVVLTGTNNDIMSRNIKRDAAVKYPRRRGVFTLTRFSLKSYRRKLFKSYRKRLCNRRALRYI